MSFFCNCIIRLHLFENKWPYHMTCVCPLGGWASSAAQVLCFLEGGWPPIWLQVASSVSVPASNGLISSPVPHTGAKELPSHNCHSGVSEAKTKGREQPQAWLCERLFTLCKALRVSILKCNGNVTARIMTCECIMVHRLSPLTSNSLHCSQSRFA